MHDAPPTLCVCIHHLHKDRNLQLFFSMTYMSLAAGIVLCLVALCGAVADLRTSRLILSLYIAVLVVVITMLIFTAVVSFWILRWTRTRPTRIVSVLRRSWMISVAEHADAVCAVQARYNCFGFDDDVCVGCWAMQQNGGTGLSTCPDTAQYKNRTDQCPFCAGETKPDVRLGCYSAFVTVAGPLYLAVGVASSVVAALLVVDVPVVICL